MRQFLVKHIGWPAVQDEITSLYEQAFTEQELDEMVKFYRTPTGKKALREFPRLMQAGMEIGARRLQQNMPELQAIVKQAEPGK